MVGGACTHLYVNHSDSNQTWPSKSSYIWKKADICFLCVCFTALWSKYKRNWQVTTLWRKIEALPIVCSCLNLWHFALAVERFLPTGYSKSSILLSLMIYVFLCALLQNAILMRWLSNDHNEEFIIFLIKWKKNSFIVVYFDYLLRSYYCYYYFMP